MTMPTWKTLGKFDWQRSDGICLHLSFDTYMISHEARHLLPDEVVALYALITTQFDADALKTAPEAARFALTGRYDELLAGLSADDIANSIDRVLPRALAA
jgi:hypothetical protein